MDVALSDNHHLIACITESGWLMVAALTDKVKWKPPSLSELTLITFDMELTHLGSEASIYKSVETNIITILNSKL